MDLSALTSHIAGKKHLEISSLRKSQSGALFFSKKAKHDRNYRKSDRSK